MSNGLAKRLGKLEVAAARRRRRAVPVRIKWVEPGAAAPAADHGGPRPEAVAIHLRRPPPPQPGAGGQAGGRTGDLLPWMGVCPDEPIHPALPVGGTPVVSQGQRRRPAPGPSMSVAEAYAAGCRCGQCQTWEALEWRRRTARVERRPSRTSFDPLAIVGRW